MKGLAEAIRARGFRKWYEARLIECHLHLVTTFLCLIVVVAAIEQGGPYNAWASALTLLAITVGFGGLGAWCWKRYFDILKTAEFLGARSTCPQCAAYARFELLYTGPRDDDVAAQDAIIADIPTLFVRCRKCRARWTM